MSLLEVVLIITVSGAVIAWARSSSRADHWPSDKERMAAGAPPHGPWDCPECGTCFREKPPYCTRCLNEPELADAIIARRIRTRTQEPEDG